jgi:coenzyme F420-0:L-glutamate ligase/coenzyme F420-1:gamma-L-glutamate ligase
MASALKGNELRLHALRDIPLVHEGDDITSMMLAAIARAELTVDDGDVLAVAQKIVSKTEGRTVHLADVTASAEAIALADELEKDPRLVELILAQSDEVVRTRPGVLIVRHKLGFVHAHAGIDQSNVDHADGDSALLLPEDPDGSARAIHEAIREQTGHNVGVLIVDSMNRPHRLGTIGTAIGSAGITVLDDLRGADDLFGRELKVSITSRADSLAAAANFLMGEADEQVPAVLIKGLPEEDSDAKASELIRPLEDDLFR